MAQELLAKNVYRSCNIYRAYLERHNLVNDTSSITAEDVVQFVEDMDEEERKSLEESLPDDVRFSNFY